MPGTSHPGKILINSGTWTDTCTTEFDLIANAAKRPAIRDFMEYSNRRALCTLLVSDVITPYGIDNTQKTNIPDVLTKGKGIGNNGYQFAVMGRLEKPSVILRQVGSTVGDRFQLLMNDRHLYDGQNVVFHGGRFIAMVDGNPTGNAQSGFLYSFFVPSGDTFSWATHVAPQQGTKTCMAAYTSYGEKSQKSDSRSKFADMFINHTTKQRKTCEITGDAASDILWYTFQGADGGTTKGWMYAQLQQAQATWAMEDERQKWFGVSTMKNSDGTMKTTPPVNSHGEALIAGDGWEEQTAGGIVISGSGTGGMWTADDITEALVQLALKGDKQKGSNYVGITGKRGFLMVQEIAPTIAADQNTRFINQVEKNGGPGGPLVEVGYQFLTLNLGGSTITFIEHPLFDDELMWTERGDDGNILMSSTVFIMDQGTGENKNMEILHKSANGVNRQNVTARLNGLTGAPEMVISESDSMKYAMLKEDLLVLYNSNKAAILRKDN